MPQMHINFAFVPLGLNFVAIVLAIAAMATNWLNHCKEVSHNGIEGEECYKAGLNEPHEGLTPSNRTIAFISLTFVCLVLSMVGGGLHLFSEHFKVSSFFLATIGNIMAGVFAAIAIGTLFGRLGEAETAEALKQVLNDKTLLRPGAGLILFCFVGASGLITGSCWFISKKRRFQQGDVGDDTTMRSESSIADPSQSYSRSQLSVTQTQSMRVNKIK